MSHCLQRAKIYTRLNGDHGASCDGIQDTGHVIIEAEPERFTVYPIDGSDEPLVRNASRRAAELIIEQDWRAAE